MKIINGKFRELCKIECLVCGEDHWLKLTQDLDDQSVYFELWESDYSLWTRLKFWLKIKSHFDQFTRFNIKNDNRDTFGIDMNVSMISQFIKELGKYGYGGSKNYYRRICHPNGEYVVIFDAFSIYITKNLAEQNISFAIYPGDRQVNKWSYANGRITVELKKDQVKALVAALEDYKESKWQS